MAENTTPTIRCRYCKRIAYWVRPATGAQICSSCKVLLVQRNWHGLALRWLTNYPEDWAPDVAAFLETEADHEASDLERQNPLKVCDGCDGSECGSSPHRYRKVLPISVVVAMPIRGKGGSR